LWSRSFESDPGEPSDANWRLHVIAKDGAELGRIHYAAKTTTEKLKRRYGLKRMSAREGTRLETILKATGRDLIINTGAWTNMSVEHTARTGADKGYFMIVPEDCCSTMNGDWHNASINFAMQNVAVVTRAEPRDRAWRRHGLVRQPSETRSSPHDSPAALCRLRIGSRVETGRPRRLGLQHLAAQRNRAVGTNCTANVAFWSQSSSFSRQIHPD
jgi:hypothetical protein